MFTFVFRIWIYFGSEPSWTPAPGTLFHMEVFADACWGMWSWTMAPHRGAVLPAEPVWKSRGLVEQDIYFLGQKECNLALGSGGKSWRTGLLPTLCDTKSVFLNEWPQGFSVGHTGFMVLAQPSCIKKLKCGIPSAPQCNTWPWQEWPWSLVLPGRRHFQCALYTMVWPGAAPHNGPVASPLPGVSPLVVGAGAHPCPHCGTMPLPALCPAPYLKVTGSRPPT